MTEPSEGIETPEHAARREAERTGIWPKDWGPFHRHFANDAVHRDGGPECDQPGTRRRVYVFDGDYLDEYDKHITDRVRAEERQQILAELERCYEGGEFSQGLMEHLRQFVARVAITVPE